MKAFEIQKSFGLDSLAAVDRPDAIPGPGQVVVRMKAVSLNYRDLLMVRGHYYPKQPLPLIPLSDGAGEVVLVGDGVTRAKVGDRVMAIFAQRWISGEPTKAKLLSALGGPLDGTLCEEMVLDEEGLVHVPPHLSWEEAATLPCAAVTSWSALVTEGGIEPGDTVLVLGTGGVSIFALQIARLHGARVIVTSSSDAKLERARALGAAETINYLATPDWEKRVRELTEGTGADHVIEVGGGG
ncbi:MAG TPA: NAD(P)-dependent alcohol dehydrogenase, partial [Vicinamibacteria bacterium]|nr:NAD(P)-dependent alcohol dehydrogenase [Vicinamibacteria bacterium]